MKTHIAIVSKAALSLLAGSCLLVGTPAHAQTLLINESFNKPAMPSDWTTPNPNWWAVDVATYQGQNHLRFARPAGSTVADHVAYYKGKGIDNSLTDSKLANFEASVVINTGNVVERGASSVAGGMIIKANSLTSYGVAAGSYFIAFSPAALSGSTTWAPGLGIWSNLPDDPAGVRANYVRTNQALAFDSFSTFTDDMDVLLKVISNGSMLSASLWTLDENGLGKDEIASVSIDNAATDPGYIGLRGAFSNTGVNLYFRDLQVTAIPEPSAALLLPLSAIMGLALKWRPRNR